MATDPIPIIPWEPINLPAEIQAELNRRKLNRGFNYVNNQSSNWDNDGDWRQYKGPMSPWVRFCSNSMGRKETKKSGFVFFGGKEFYTSYGFKSSPLGLDNQSIIGYLPDGVNTHTIENDLTSPYPIHVPPPEIERITVTIQKELFRRASIEWVCFSKKQLEYMTPYFLIPGITCTLEWGWNHFDPANLIDLNSISDLKKLTDNLYLLYTDHILKSKGNYDVMFGKVTNFEWSVEGNKFKCKTEVTSQDRLISGLEINSHSSEQRVELSKKDLETNAKIDAKIDAKIFGNFKAFLEKLKVLKYKIDDQELVEFVNYVKGRHPNTWPEYLYGVFVGRIKDAVPFGATKTTLPGPFGGGTGLNDYSDQSTYPATISNDKRHDKDFDKDGSSNVWITMGLVVEMINFFTKELTSFKKHQMLLIDIDDVVIKGHTNLISTNGEVLLIPNAHAPKYFYGAFGNSTPLQTKEDYNILSESSDNPVIFEKAKDVPADYIIKKTCIPVDNAIRRDNLNELINDYRQKKSQKSLDTFSFPFEKEEKPPGTDGEGYPAKNSGYLKNLYVGVDTLIKNIHSTDKITFFTDFIEKTLKDITSAAGNFWNFSLVSGTGRNNMKPDDQTTMKIVDSGFIYTLNRGQIYTFDYFDADSILLGIGFKPTLSNAQAIRTIYAQTNRKDGAIVVSSGNADMLDYKFEDRLFNDEQIKSDPKATEAEQSAYKRMMMGIQGIVPKSDAYQMTTENNGKTLIRRLAIPKEADSILKILLDDKDFENNPNYTGIMPGITATFTLQGIGGIRTFMVFLVRNLPEPYSEKNIIFRVVDVQEAIENGKWTTTINAGVIPLRGHIKRRLFGQSKTS